MELALNKNELTTGLLGRTTAGNGLFLMGANTIHTFQMKFPIDVIYLDKYGKVVGLDENLQPGRNGSYFRDATHVVEFNSGTIYENEIRIKEQWDWHY